MNTRRAPVIGLLAVALAGAGVVDRVRPVKRTSTVRATATMPVAAPAGSLSSTWFCPAATTTPGSPLGNLVAIANTSGRAVTADVTIMPADPKIEAAAHSLDVGARSVAYVDLAAIAPKIGPAGVVVRTDGGQVVVEHTGGHNTEVCATASSHDWYFASGTTAKDATLLLALFNPYPEDAIADLRFETDQGTDTPSDFQGLVIPGGSTRIVDVGEHVRRRDSIATHVTVRNGRLVAEQVQQRTAPGVAGVSLTRGAPAPQTRWYLPDGFVSAQVTERVTLYNPTATEAQVEAAPALEKGSAEPFDLTVPANGTVSLQLNQEARIPKDDAFALTVTSMNGVPVVVQRTVEVAPTPGARFGRADTMAATMTAKRWALAFGTASATADQWITVLNPGSAPAHVSIAALADGQLLAVEGLQDLVVPPGGRQSVRLGDHVKRDSLPVVVDADRPVVVERSLLVTSGEGVMETMAVPLDQTG